MNTNKITNLMAQAAEIDNTVGVSIKQLKNLKEKKISAKSYNRNHLYENMAIGKPSIFKDFPRPLFNVQDCDFESLMQLYGHITSNDIGLEYAVRVGPSYKKTRTDLSQIMKLWALDADMLAITDLHFRGTKLDSVINPSKLSEFNLLCDGGKRLTTLEMMTLMISTKGSITESHSDDADGSNHCFTGKKLWLVWDTEEGMEAGLEDCEKELVIGQANFNMEIFLNLRSSRWFLMNQGKTLFLPGNYTHKVLTVEKYIGVGSFCVTLPNVLRTITRWSMMEPLFSRRYGKEIADEFLHKIIRTARRRAKGWKTDNDVVANKWGTKFIPIAYESWNKEFSVEVREKALCNKKFSKLVDEYKSLSYQ